MIYKLITIIFVLIGLQSHASGKLTDAPPLAHKYCFAEYEKDPFTPYYAERIHLAFKTWSSLLSELFDEPYELEFQGYVHVASIILMMFI